MILKGDEVERELDSPQDGHLLIIPRPQIQAGNAATDLRLGTWLLSLRQSKLTSLDLDGESPNEHRMTKRHYVPFGEKFVLHPGAFILGATFEWIRLPSHLAGYVMGKSSWGRRGLVIETAAGIHPGFSGCLTLEMTNLGEIPISVYPGMPICQLFLHRAAGGPAASDSKFKGRRRPALGEIRPDDVMNRLRQPL